jgi:DNA sulfur modification protein DndE
LTRKTSPSSKLKLSKAASDKVDLLSNRLDIRRNIVCRLAVGRSLREPKSVRSLKPANDDGREFNRYTLTGDFDPIFKALIVQHEAKKVNDREYFAVFLRNHIENGINLLYKEFNMVNSPVEFLVSLACSPENGKLARVEAT